jgi:hypothetical protein
MSDRLAVIGFGEAERNALKTLEPVIERVLGAALEGFDRHAEQFPGYREARTRLADVGQDFAGAGTRRYWQTALAGHYDDEHARMTTEHGASHYRAKFPPRWAYPQRLISDSGVTVGRSAGVWKFGTLLS